MHQQMSLKKLADKTNGTEIYKKNYCVTMNAVLLKSYGIMYIENLHIHINLQQRNVQEK